RQPPRQNSGRTRYHKKTLGKKKRILNPTILDGRPVCLLRRPITSTAGSSPAWVLLDRQARVAYRRNGTTARAVSSRRLDIEVSFCFAEPPRLSRCCIYSPPGPARAEFVRGSCVVCSAGGIAVLRLEIGGGGVCSEYYLYRANPERPSLRLLTLPAASWELFHANDTNLCILPCAGGDEGGIVLATLYLVTDPHADHLHKAGHLHLQIFSSESWDWNTKLVVLDPFVPQGEELFYFANNFAANKVISLGEGLLGWVDLSKVYVLRKPSQD
uniref:DUF1618 domain-containing protein n=1 Tax=Oryza punctata TaxID=4537 RepID=A0A0E0K9V9_ORYPU